MRTSIRGIPKTQQIIRVTESDSSLHGLNMSGVDNTNKCHLIAILSCALLVRLLVVCFAGEMIIVDEQQYVDAGTKWTTGYIDTFLAPGYPAFLAAVFGIAGYRLDFVRLLQSLFGTLAVFQVFVLGKRLYSVRTGLLAALVAALLPELVGFSSLLYTETLFLPLLLGSFCCLVPTGRYRRTVAAGFLFGAAVLVRDIAFYYAICVGAFLLFGEPTRARGVRHCAVFLCGVIVVTFPWMAFHSSKGGGFAISSNRWKVVFEGNHYDADVQEYQEMFMHDRNAAELFARDRAKQYIVREQPLWLVRKVVHMGQRMWEPNNFLYRQMRLAGAPVWSIAAAFVVSSLFLLGLLVLALLGCLVMPIARTHMLIWAFIPYILAVHTVSDAVSRHRLILLPLLCLSAGVSLDSVLSGRPIRHYFSSAGYLRILLCSLCLLGVVAVWCSWFFRLWAD